jgi:hypothetical protein
MPIYHAAKRGGQLYGKIPVPAPARLPGRAGDIAIKRDPSSKQGRERRKTPRIVDPRRLPKPLGYMA